MILEKWVGILDKSNGGAKEVLDQAKRKQGKQEVSKEAGSNQGIQ